MRYAIARYADEQKELAYRIYITDTLYYQGQNKVINIRYEDLINPKKEDKRSGDEIALDVISNLDLRFD